MLILLIPAAVLTLASFLLALLFRLGLALFRRPAPRFWRRTFAWHGWLFALHLFVTVPLLLGFVLSHAGTRRDEAAYRGPRIAPDGTWLVQTRGTLAAERSGKVAVDPALVESAERCAVSLTARDGVKLRAFLVPLPPGAVGESPRFVAVLVHGLYRDALETETPGRMLRDLGGEVLLLELRNHGGSGKAQATFGRDESLDVLAAAEFLRARPEASGRPLMVFAVSLGTAAAALAAPRLPGLAGLVLDAPMDDLRATARRELERGDFKFSIRNPWAATILWSAQHLAGVPIDAVKPHEALERLPPNVAVLLIGAGRDERMPPDAVCALFDELPTEPGRKELWIEPEATHGKVWVAAPDAYREHLARFCARLVGE
jgi:hypothetical protein